MDKIDEKKRKSRNLYEDIHPYKEIKQLNNNAYKVWRTGAERCVICGSECSTTKEHLPPQSIYIQTPADVIVVRACKKCQKSPDREFSDFLASYCVAKGATESSEKLLTHRVNRSEETPMSSKYIQHVRKNSNMENVCTENKVGIITQSLIATWPSALHDPIILKMIHGYYWLLTKGKILSDEIGKIIIVNDFNPNSEEANFLVGRAFPSGNIGNNQFICTHIQGFEESYDTIVSMGFHFHTDGSTKCGYHVMVFLYFDRIALVNTKYRQSMKENLYEVAPDRVFDIQKPVYCYYPY